MKIKDENHLFKEPNSNTLLNRKGNLRPTISEKSRLPGRLKNDSKVTLLLEASRNYIVVKF